VGRQRRLRIDETWFRVDLLFFHRRLRCLVIIDLKLGEFTMPMWARCTCTATTPGTLDAAWRKPACGPDPVRRTNAAVAHYALEGLPNKVLAAEYQTVLPDENCWQRS
jgi:hypothetical protein